MTTDEQIKEAAQCLLGIDDEWGFDDIEGFLNWQFDNLDELPEGYPKPVMQRRFEDLILKEVKYLLSKK